MNEPTVRTLARGGTLVVEKIPGVRSAGLTWLVPAGIATDPKDRLGRAAVLEEMLMRGAGELDSRAQADAFDRLGAARGACAGTTHLRLSLTCLGSALGAALPLVGDMVLRPRLGADSLGPAKDLAVQSIESLADDPQERCVYAARERHYDPPFNRSGLGTREGIAALTRDEIADSWTAATAPGGWIVSAAGDVDADAIEHTLNAMGEQSGRVAPEVSSSGGAPRGYAHETDDSNQVQIVVVHDGPLETHEDAVLERVVVSVLAGGMSGRLFTEVREKRGLCYAVSASYRADKLFAGVSAYVGTTPERAQESLDVLLAELARVRDGIEPDEFERAITGMKSRLVFAGESTSARAGALAGDMRVRGRPRSLAERTAEIDGVTLDRVNGYLSRRDPGRLTIQTLGPSPLTPPA